MTINKQTNKQTRQPGWYDTVQCAELSPLNLSSESLSLSLLSSAHRKNNVPDVKGRFSETAWAKYWPDLKIVNLKKSTSQRCRLYIGEWELLQSLLPSFFTEDRVYSLHHLKKENDGRMVRNTEHWTMKQQNTSRNTLYNPRDGVRDKSWIQSSQHVVAVESL